jgi:tellurium resistance protein TerZ
MEREISNSAEIVMGLRWDPPEGCIADPIDLDAICILFDTQGRVVEVVHPGHRQNVNGSVVHTGDAVTGASVWDDERVFVFLDALPDTVAAVGFVVVSASRHTFNEVRGAFCDISDHATDDVYVRVHLSALDSREATWISTLRRNGLAWVFQSASPKSDGVNLTMKSQ